MMNPNMMNMNSTTPQFGGRLADLAKSKLAPAAVTAAVLLPVGAAAASDTGKADRPVTTGHSIATTMAASSSSAVTQLNKANAFIPTRLRNVSPAVYAGAPSLPLELSAAPSEAQAKKDMLMHVRAYAKREKLNVNSRVKKTQNLYNDATVQRIFPDYTLRAKFLIGFMATDAHVALDGVMAQMRAGKYNPVQYDGITEHGASSPARISPGNIAETFEEDNGTLSILLNPAHKRQPTAVGASVLVHEFGHKDSGEKNGFAEETVTNAVQSVVEAQLHLNQPSLSQARTRVMQSYNTQVLEILNTRQGSRIKILRPSGDIFPGSPINPKNFFAEIQRIYAGQTTNAPSPGNADIAKVLRNMGVKVPNNFTFNQATLKKINVQFNPLTPAQMVALYRQLGAVAPRPV